MAQVELFYGGARNDAIKVWFRYDDATLQVNRMRWANTSGENAELFIAGEKFVVPTANSGQRALPPGTLNLVVVGDPGDTSLAYDKAIEFGSAAAAKV